MSEEQLSDRWRVGVIDQNLVGCCVNDESAARRLKDLGGPALCIRSSTRLVAAQPLLLLRDCFTAGEAAHLKISLEHSVSFCISFCRVSLDDGVEERFS